MNYNGLLPIGSVVLLKNSKKRVMIVGVCQNSTSNAEKVWDYTGVLFPEGYLSGDKMFMFNNPQIDMIYALGYQDSEQLQFKQKIDDYISAVRASESEQMPEQTQDKQ